MAEDPAVVLLRQLLEEKVIVNFTYMTSIIDLRSWYTVHLNSGMLKKFCSYNEIMDYFVLKEIHEIK